MAEMSNSDGMPVTRRHIIGNLILGDVSPAICANAGLMMIEEAVLSEMADGGRHDLLRLMKNLDLPPSVETRSVLASIVERMVRFEILVKEDDGTFSLAYTELSLRLNDEDEEEATQPPLGV